MEPPRAFFLYRDSPLRREALRAGPGDGARYSLYGLDEVAASGVQVDHNLGPDDDPGLGARALGRALPRSLGLLGGYSGDFRGVLAVRSRLNRSDVVFSTVDTVGIPLVLLARAGLVRVPIVYAAIGLPERLEQLRNGAMEAFYRDAYRRVHTIVAYGSGEVDALGAWLGEGGPRVELVPFGVQTEFFSPGEWATLSTDVVSIGGDPRRDYELLLRLARRHPEWSFDVVASSDHAPALAGAPPNVRVELDVPFDVVRDRLRAARVVALPVRDNTYSGATTVLLQAMATGKPVVVSRTAAIARGYHLEDGENCRLVEPGDEAAFDRAVADLLADDERAAAIGARARRTVERELGWERYADRIRDLLLAAAGRTTVPA